jgi:hypothetical protein
VGQITGTARLAFLIQYGAVPALISPDGRWWWDGQHWRSRLVEGRLDLFWFTSTPDWFTRVVVIGLIGLIPIVGTINLFGWTLTATDMVRTGWKELPPAGFQHLERGVAPFLVALVYGAVLVTLVVVLTGLTVFLAASGRGAAAQAIGLGLLVVLLTVAWWLVSLYLFAALLIGSDRLGLARAIDPRRLFALARANHEVSLRVAVISGVAHLVFGAITIAVGFVVPFGGLVISIGLPAVYAVLVPSLAAFRVESAPGPPPA